VLDQGSGAVRLAELTRNGRPLLLDLTEGSAIAEALSDLGERVDVVTARPLDASTPAKALLLRPDCYVAWASGSSNPEPAELDGLRAALARWFGVGLENRSTVGSSAGSH